MQRKKQQLTPRSPLQWITDTIDDLLHSPTDSDIDSDSNSVSDSELEASDPLDSWEPPPNTQPEISFKITHVELRRGFKVWTESTATSPSGRHLGHYKSLVKNDDMEDFSFTKWSSPSIMGFHHPDGQMPCKLCCLKTNELPRWNA